MAIREQDMGTATSESSPKNILQDIGGVRFKGDEVTMAHALVGLGLVARLLIRIANDHEGPQHVFHIEELGLS